MRNRFSVMLAASMLPIPALSQLVEHTVATGLRFGYQAAAADINGDGRIDVTCIDSAAPNSLKWYENTGDW